MIIRDIQPLSLGQVKELVTNLEEKQNLHDYIKKFSKLSKADAEKLFEEVKVLNNSKIRDSDIVKIADFLPKDAEALNKIFNEVSLTEEESNAILEIVKKY